MDIREQLAYANRILVKHGVLDAYGHVSVRDPSDSDFFLLARNMAPANVASDDIQRFDLDAVADDDRKSYLERFIHSEIYRARPDIAAVVHSHSPSVLPFTVSRTRLRALTHLGGFLGRGAPVFEIRSVSGTESNLMVTSPGEGKALAETLGPGHIVLMRGHGSVAVGRDLATAVHRAIFTEISAKTQQAALLLGDVEYLTDEEAAAALAANDGQVKRAWDLWLSEVM